MTLAAALRTPPDPKRSEVRVLTLEVGLITWMVECSLTVMNLGAAASSHMALSWVWGDARAGRPILIGGEECW